MPTGLLKTEGDAPPQMPPVMLVDDDRDDAYLFSHVLEAGIKNPIIRFTDAAEAQRYLEGAAAGVNAMPCVVLTDIRMPCIGGFDFVANIRAHAALVKLPIAFVTGSDIPEDRQRAQALGITDFFVKFPPVAEVMEFINRQRP